jgi:hypothetical protein
MHFLHVFLNLEDVLLRKLNRDKATAGAVEL